MGVNCDAKGVFGWVVVVKKLSWAMKKLMCAASCEKVESHLVQTIVKL